MKVKKKIGGYAKVTELDKRLPVISPADPVLNALANAPLPLPGILASCNLKGDEGRLCRLWALHVAAGSHTQTPRGERFEGPTLKQASYYDPTITTWWNDSRSLDGGSMKLTQNGFNKLMYGKAVNESGSSGIPAHVFLTNGGVAGTGYRFIVGGRAVVDYYATEVHKLRDVSLRIFFLKNILAMNEALLRSKSEEAAHTALPVPLQPHQSLYARVTYGHNRRVDSSVYDASGLGYVTISVRQARCAALLAMLFGNDVPVEPRAQIRMGPDGYLVINAHPLGWKITDQGVIQASTLGSANISQPLFDLDEVVYANIPIENPSIGTVLLKIPTAMFGGNGTDGSGLPSRSSNGSMPGRARSKVAEPVRKRRIDE